MTLKDLAAVALRGTARAEVPKPDPGPLGEVLARVQEGSPEQLLLARAALAGLHARAGKALDAAGTPPPVTLPPAAHPLPEKLWPLLRPLLNSPAFESALSDVSAKGWTLSAAQVLGLYASNQALAAHLWPLLDERGKAVLDAHPIHKAWEKADAEARWYAQLETLREARQTDAGAGAAQTLELWKEVDANGRRDLLDMLERGLLPEDLPLLQHAEKDRSSEVQRRARMLQGHLAGPLQDELLALLPQVVTKKGDQLRFKPFELPAALGKVKANAYDDSDLHRLLGALPLSLILKTLDISASSLKQAARKHHWTLENQLKEAQHREEEARYSATSAAPVILPQHVARWLRGIQEKGYTDRAALERFAQHLDPAAEIAAPEPLPVVFPELAGGIPKRLTRDEWENNVRKAHAERQAEAEAAWRSLTDILRLRREWAAALEAEK